MTEFNLKEGFRRAALVFAPILAIPPAIIIGYNVYYAAYDCYILLGVIGGIGAWIVCSVAVWLMVKGIGWVIRGFREHEEST